MIRCQTFYFKLFSLQSIRLPIGPCLISFVIGQFSMPDIFTSIFSIHLFLSLLFANLEGCPCPSKFISPWYAEVEIFLFAFFKKFIWSLKSLIFGRKLYLSSDCKTSIQQSRKLSFSNNRLINFIMTIKKPLSFLLNIYYILFLLQTKS